MLPCRFPQVRQRGACLVTDAGGPARPACEQTLRQRDGRWERMLVATVLARPEHALAVVQSGCQLDCRHCHSAGFTRESLGEWTSADELARYAAEYAGWVTVEEPRERWTLFHAEDLCRSCGRCVVFGERADLCPGALADDQVLSSPQGMGPARNLVFFTGGEVLCQPGWYAAATRAIRQAAPSLHVLLETTGASLDDEALDLLVEAGLEAVALDLKALDPAIHRRLTGLEPGADEPLVRRLRERGLGVEVRTVLVPGLVERDELGRIARSVAAVDPSIPVTLSAFFPAHRMGEARSPGFEQMIDAAHAMLGAGLQRFRLANLAVFCHTGEQLARADALRG